MSAQVWVSRDAGARGAAAVGVGVHCRFLAELGAHTGTQARACASQGLSIWGPAPPNRPIEGGSQDRGAPQGAPGGPPAASAARGARHQEEKGKDERSCDTPRAHENLPLRYLWAQPKLAHAAGSCQRASAAAESRRRGSRQRVTAVAARQACRGGPPARPRLHALVDRERRRRNSDRGAYTPPSTRRNLLDTATYTRGRQRIGHNERLIAGGWEGGRSGAGRVDTKGWVTARRRWVADGARPQPPPPHPEPRAIGATA